MLEAILAAAALIFAAIDLIYVVIILFDRIATWFRARESLRNADKDNIAFSIKQKLESGEYKVVYGIFNKRQDELCDVDAVVGKKVDAEIEKHKADTLMIYN